MKTVEKEVSLSQSNLVQSLGLDSAAQSPAHWFHELGTKFVLAQIYFSLNQNGVFASLKAGGKTVADMSGELGLQEKVLTSLLDYIAGVDSVVVKTSDEVYRLTVMGEAVIERFSSNDGAINMFDVRVGCYGPVWSGLTDMLSGKASYGDGVERNGVFAEAGVSKLSKHFWPVTADVLSAEQPDVLLEVGLYSGLLSMARDQYNDIDIAGLDRKTDSIAEAAKSLDSEFDESRFIQADFNDVDSWIDSYPADIRVQLLSLHFHEIMASGYEALLKTVKAINARRPLWSILFFEKPLPDDAPGQDKNSIDWMYSHSNILIHHLIGNGQILSDEKWLDLGRSAGYKLIDKIPCNYLGYNGYVFKNT